MFLQSYQPHELHFAYCYRVYQQFRTHRSRPHSQLGLLKRSELDSLMRPYNIRVLECASDYTDVLATLSLQPLETIGSAADKLKGRVSKWLREELGLSQPTNLLSKGYFASTIGKSRKRAVENYLSAQSEHHGYAERSFRRGSNASGNRVSISAATVIWLARRFVSTSSSGGVFLSECALVAASVRLHGARPWHLQEVLWVCSGEREAPRR